MSSINPLLSQAYNSFAPDNKKNNNSQAVTSLAAALSGANSSPQSSPGGTPDVSYLLNLSEEAKHYLATQVNRTEAPQTADTKSFTLSTTEQRQIDSVIAKYKDSAFTQETFDALLAELKTAGLDPQTLAAKDQVRQINPTQAFLSALNGTDSNPFSAAGSADQQAKGDAYLQRIYDQFKNISKTAPANVSA